MSERPRFNLHTVANEYVNHIEDEWVNRQFQTVADLKTRADGSKTQITRNEYEAADDALSREIDRLTPPDVKEFLDDCDDIDPEESGR